MGGSPKGPPGAPKALEESPVTGFGASGGEDDPRSGRAMLSRSNLDGGAG